MLANDVKFNNGQQHNPSRCAGESVGSRAAAAAWMFRWVCALWWINWRPKCTKAQTKIPTWQNGKETEQNRKAGKTKSYENLSRSMYDCVFLVLRALAKTEGAREVSETEMIIYCMRLAQQKMKFFNQTATNKIHAAPTRRYAMPNLMPHSLPRE